MAVNYKGRAQKSTSTGTLTFSAADFNTSLVAGDLLVACIAGVDANAVEATVNSPAGWVNRVNYFVLGSDIAVVDIWTKEYSALDTTYSFTDGSEFGTTFDILGTILVLSGHNSASPISGSYSFDQGTTATSQVIPSLTTAHANTMLVASAIMSGTTTAYSSTGTMTERATVSEATAPARLVAATEEFAGPGATGTRTFTAGAAGIVYAMVIIAVREAPAPSTSPRVVATVRPSAAVHRSTRW